MPESRPTAEDWKQCRSVIARHSKSFDLASRLFPRDRRDEVAALYGYCRGCDDAIDLVAAGQQPAALAEQRRVLEAVYGDDALDDPVLVCFREVVARRSIPIEYPRELIAGMEMDVENVSYDRVDDLLLYCWRVAGTVGLMMCHVMGVRDARAARPAAHLGIAMQLTNICRDVVEDWQRGRVYVPAELLGPSSNAWLEAHRKLESATEIVPEARDAFPRAIEELLSLAARFYASADEGLRYLAPRSALSVRVARLLYAEIGEVIAARGFDVFQGRAFVPAPRRLRLAGRGLLHFLSERGMRDSTPLTSPNEILLAEDAVRLPG